MAAVMKPNSEDITYLPGGDVLIIIPPFVDTKIPSLGAHSLQASCRPSGLSVRVFYANLNFSNLIGLELHDTIMRVNQATFMGERLFAASAFGLPPMGRNLHKLFDPHWLPDHMWQKKREYACRLMGEIFAPVREWAVSIDWGHVEEQAARWTAATAEQIAGRGYCLVGCSTTHGGMVPPVALLNRIKQANPDIITVIGGALCEGVMAEGILSLKAGIDYVFSGEGEITFPGFAGKVLGGRLPGEKIIYGKEVTNLDTVPLPDFSEYFYQREKIYPKQLSCKGDIRVPYETSRGCRWRRCTFCGVSGERQSYRIKSAGKVIKDLGQLVNRHRINSIDMADNIMPLPYFETLIPQIPGDIPLLRIQYELKADVTLEQMIALKKAGITRIQPGIESLSPSLLKRMQKGVTVRQIIALLRYARSLGIKVFWNILFGFPGDQTGEYEEMLRILPLIRHLPPPARMTTMRIFRFSKYQTEPEKFGISNLRPAELHKDVFPSHADLEKTAYFFTGDFEARSYENPEIIASLRKEYRAWLREWSNYEVPSLESLLPALHLERKSPGRFILHDTRGLPGRPEKTVVDKEQAKMLLVTRCGGSPGEFKWLLDAGLGIFSESRFIPLATAEPGLLQEFERDNGHND
jgi:ribosomal peptide maturation radical SAM protein 1